MSSKKQLAANRQNAQKSTGPKNTENTRFNACYHGLRGSRVVLAHESMDEYVAMAQTFYNDFQPVGTYEHDLVRRLADRHWELARIVALKSNVSNNADYRDVRDEELLRLERYETSIERSLFRTRRELTQVQRLRGKTFARSEAPTAPILYETTLYHGPHHQPLYSQGEVAVEHLQHRAIRELKRYSSRSERTLLNATITHMAEHLLATQSEEPDQEHPTG